MSDTRILLGVPSGEMVHGRFMIDLLTLFCHSKDLVLDTINYRSSRITENRNAIVKAAFDFGSSHILFIDSDMTFPRDGLLTLLQHDKDIVCATATKREEGSNAPIGIPFDEQGRQPIAQRLIRMRFVGMPFMLVRRKVFEAMSQPYFAEPVIDGELVPEDTYFCRRALAAGYDIWCDLNLSMQIGHLGTKEYKIAPLNPGKPELKVVGA